MYWPSTCRGGEFIHRKFAGDFVDPDEYLKNVCDGALPVVSPAQTRAVSLDEQEAAVSAALKKQLSANDPLKKSGIIGAFCRTYSIEAAIEKFASDIYVPSEVAGRYDYIMGEGSNGVVTYENRYFYSFHGTDPLRGKLLNAFDFVRLLKFGKKKEGFRKMLELCHADAKVEDLFQRESSTGVEGAVKTVSNEAWLQELKYNNDGTLKSTLDNMVNIIKHDENLLNFGFNEQTYCIEKTGELPWKSFGKTFDSEDYAGLRCYFSAKYGLECGVKLKDAVKTVAAGRSFNPIRDMLEQLPAWDGEKRLSRVLVEVMGAEPSAYLTAVVQKTFVAAVARVYEPGIKFDYMTVLVGKGGIGKSTFWNIIAKGFYTENFSFKDIRDKTGSEKLQKYWIVEVSELSGLKEAEVEAVKSFISLQNDTYRKAYGEDVTDHPRRCILVGSTNEEQGFLYDTTGNRRFLPIAVKAVPNASVWSMTEDYVAQLWAEALYLYRQGYSLHLSKEEEAMAADVQMEYRVKDDRQGYVEQYLEVLLPLDWDNYPLKERRAYIKRHLSGDYHDVHEELVPRMTVCNAAIYEELFEMDKKDIKNGDSREMRAILSQIAGWQNRGKNRKYYRNYGQQQYYERVGEVAIS